MNFAESNQYLYSLGNEVKTIKLGLEQIRLLLAALDNPQSSCPVIHVAGTNGKGTVCALIERVLRAAGHRTGLFTSPHLVDFRERIRVGGRWADAGAATKASSRSNNRAIMRLPAG